MTHADTLARFRLARAEGVGPVTYRRMLQRYGSAAAALDALPGLARAGGRTTPPRVPSEAAAAREAERLEKLGARLLFADTDAYPRLLALLDDAPPVIAVQGDAALLDARSVALVGGRNASANGQRMAETLAADLAAAGLVVVSGLARGIDAAAHRGAMARGRTVAVIAGGLDVPYPPENADLQRAIAEAGAVVAEAPLGTEPLARHFPRRNRIIAGLVLGIVVVEAAPRSGSLITARLGQEAGREIFAVPGSPLDPRARGANDLLRQGAVLTESATDVLDNLPDHPMREGIGRSPLFARGLPPGMPTGLGAPRSFLDPPDPAPHSAGETADAHRQLLELLEASPTPVDDLVRRCQFSPAAVMAALLELELAGRVETLPGNRVALLDPGMSPGL
ncbi:MAG: DNA-protecting protein DprA [Proteobacteria bacterium]|nr:DNA-protecting protein DprA [Pseudomonadota bacterium]